MIFPPPQSASHDQRPPSRSALTGSFPSAVLQSLSNTTPPVPGGTTVTVALPLCPSLVAVIMAEPASSPVTTPLLLTPATVGLLELHVTTRPARALPLASLGVAASCTAWPTPTLAVAGLTATEATGTAVTDTTADPLCPSLVAMIVAVPAATPVTSPPASTVATAGALLAHVTTRP